MIHKNSFPRLARFGLILGIALTFALPASAEWKEKVLYSFQGGTDGSVPIGSLIRDSAGNIYGATEQGGATTCRSPLSCGTVFQLVPPAKQGAPWTENVLHVFQGNANNDGATPGGGLVMDSSGNLYGVTAYGGTGNCVLLGDSVGCGAVYEMSPPQQKGGAWTETILYSFPTSKRGYLPNGDLVFDKSGNLYGATVFGGTKGTTCDPYYGGQCGVVFEISRPKQKGGAWTQKVLHDFPGIASGKQYGDGAEPNGGLVLDSKSTIYGTSYIGGYNCPHHSGLGCGTVFELTPPSGKHHVWTESLTHKFKNGFDGALPSAGVVIDPQNGFLYGAAEGGSNGCGEVFRMVIGGGRWNLTVLYGFGGKSYYYSPAVSRLDSSGNIYGTTNVGPGSHYGSVFRLKPPPDQGRAWAETTLYGFAGSPDGADANAPLTSGNSGGLYGTTQAGGSGQACQGGCGTVFEVSP